MKSYAAWKQEQNIRESADGADEIKAAFDDLRQTIQRVSESAGIFGTVKRGLFGATKGVARAMFGKDSRAAQAVPDVSSNYDLHRTSTLGTLGRTALGGVMDAGKRVSDSLMDGRKRRVEGVDEDGDLYLEWDKNALEVIMAKVDEVEQRVAAKVKAMSPSGAGVRRTGDNSWETDVPTGHAHSMSTSLPAGIAHTIQTELPPSTVDKMEERFETDPILQKFLSALGSSHSFTAVNKIATEMGRTAEDLADELDKKYEAGGALKNLLLQRKRATKKDVEHLKGFGHKIVKPTGEKISMTHSVTSDDVGR